MLNALLGQLGANRASTFLLTGLLPALIVRLGAVWYRTSDTSALTPGMKEFLEGKGVTLDSAIILGIAFLFYISRGAVLRFLQTLTFVPMFIRDASVRRQLKKKRKRVRESERFLWKLTALKWVVPSPIDDSTAMETPPTPSKWVITEYWKDFNSAKIASGAALEMVFALAARGDHEYEPTLKQADAVASGLLALYVADTQIPSNDTSTASAAAIAKLKKEWSTRVSEPDAVLALSRVRNVLQRAWTDAFYRARAYPEEQWVHPTRLGNRLSALDDYAEKRYGVDTGTLWSRLVGILTNEERADFANAQMRVEALANHAAALTALLIWILLSELWRQDLSELLAKGHGLRMLRWLAVTLILARVFYVASVNAFDAVAERVRRLVDLRRVKLLTTMGYAAPKTVKDEVELLTELGRFFKQGDQRKPTRNLN